MKYLDLTFQTPAQNLAFDEVLLEFCEAGYPGEILRFWEPSQYFMVLGYSSKYPAEVRTDVCQKNKIPVFRRISGGQTVLQGPGCLNYALILRIEGDKAHQTITGTNRFVMDRNRNAIENVAGENFHVRGYTDLTSGTLKFSGNAQRRKKNFLLFHGTFLLNFNLGLIEDLLDMPLRTPAYRAGRSHRDFLTNLDLPAVMIKKSMRKFWEAGEELDIIPFHGIQELVRIRYENPGWIRK